MAKFIFVTGGVVSGLGKGITTASIGLLLKNSGFSVDAIKFDPYLNIDPGTMSPYEHGEVYVLNDGSETDLDLGHYERFLDTNLTKNSSVTAGKIYNAILDKEREGEFLGKNVQLIPNVTNFIKHKFAVGLPKSSDDQDDHIRLIEIGGSTGDMEGEIFLESFRQFKQEKKSEVLHIHLGYVPFLRSTGEYKTKPLQTSIRELLRSGLQPDLIIARYSPENKGELDKNILEKIALFSNLPEKSVIKLPDLDSIYKVPVYLQQTRILPNLEKFIEKKIQPEIPEFYRKIGLPNPNLKSLTVGIVAKYPKLEDAYLSLIESLKIAGVHCNAKIKIEFIDAEFLLDEKKSEKEMAKLQKSQAIIIPGGFGGRGLEGKIVAAKYARENNIPFLGICLGLQMAVVEFARNVCSLNAFSSEMGVKNDPKNKMVIDLIPEQREIHTKGGTMRLGVYKCQIEKNTLANKLFGENEITERHRHRLEVQSEFVEDFEKHGLVISGKHFYTDKNGNRKYLVELIELPEKIHPFYIATQSHPEFLSRPNTPHPLFKGLISAALNKQ